MPGTKLARLIEGRFAALSKIETLRDRDRHDPELLGAYEQLTAANAEFEQLVATIAKKKPELRYRQRNEALYVDRDGNRWRRPSDMHQDQAHQRIGDAMNEYAHTGDLINMQVIHHSFLDCARRLD